MLCYAMYMALTKKTIKTIEELLKENLTIPEYQRPYKWTIRQVGQLLDDIKEHQNKEIPRYRIGTIVTHHDEEGKLNIVDGQQRITTLALLFHRLKELGLKKLEKNSFLEKLEYSHEVSKYNICENYKYIEEFIENLKYTKDSFITFVLKNCEVVYIELDNIDEAFQFFDSQNARGKSLEAYDLLKAFHLREIEKEKYAKEIFYEEEKRSLVSQWEHITEETLKMVFDDLYAIRKWLRNDHTSKTKRWDNGDFLKKDVNHFKGICIEEFDYPYIRNIQSPELLFEIDRPIFNGTLFFKYIIHYSQKLQQLEKKYENIGTKLTDIRKAGKQTVVLSEILKGNDTRYVFFTMLFRRVLLFYYDKFGFYDFTEATKKCANWSEGLLEKTRVVYSAVQNRAIEEDSLFKKIKNATQTKDIINI